MVKHPDDKSITASKVNISADQLKGGSFLIQDSASDSVLTSSDFTDEQRMIGEMVADFCEQEIISPYYQSGNELKVTNPEDKAIVLQLLKKAGEQGLTSVGIPESYGGMDLDFVSGTIFSEKIAKGYSFATTLGAQISIGSLPIVYYGNDAQKEKYLPGIASAELIAAYALTEPGAGSDANSGKTKAALSADGQHYILNGQKIWITNGGFADVYIVFAKIDDDKNLSAFIVEKDFPGFSTGAEEHKMGIKGSSTVQIYFEDCQVPVENLLGAREEGFKIALTILNSGRIKAGTGGVGASKEVMTKALAFAKERKQFGKSIAEFGAVQHKFGTLLAETYALDALVYRLAGLIGNKELVNKAQGMASGQAKVEAMREFAIEAAILKVAGTDLVCRAADEAIQIHGGMGYSMETGLEMAYRDSRITKIYEGTNEINTLLSVGELSKRGIVTKELDLVGAGKKVPGFLLGRIFSSNNGTDWSAQMKIVQGMKAAFLMLSGAAGKKLGKKMVDEQQLIMQLAVLLSKALIAESALLKTKKLAAYADIPADQKAAMENMTTLYVYEAVETCRQAVREAIASFATGGQAKFLNYATRQLLGELKVNPSSLRTEISNYFVEEGAYNM